MALSKSKLQRGYSRIARCYISNIPYTIISMKPVLDLTRSQSWSSLSSFWWDKEEWYQRYVVHAKCKGFPALLCLIFPDHPQRCPKAKTTPALQFGAAFAKSIENKTCNVKELMKKLTGTKEHPFNVMFGKIPLTGYADDFDAETFLKLDEVKTGKKEWTQKRVDEHGQFDMYLLMNLITNKIKPENVGCHLHWIPTQENGDFSISFIEPVTVHTFETKRTMRQVLNFGMRINSTYQEMQEYARNHA